MTQALHVANGDTINLKLQNKASCVGEALASGKPDDVLVEEACLAALSRPPHEAERARLVGALRSAGEQKRAVLGDVYWALISSREFLFNH